jgi:hypothetical protein
MTSNRKVARDHPPAERIFSLLQIHYSSTHDQIENAWSLRKPALMLTSTINPILRFFELHSQRGLRSYWIHCDQAIV